MKLKLAPSQKYKILDLFYMFMDGDIDSTTFISELHRKTDDGENGPRVFVDVLTEEGCSIEKGEYTILMGGITGGVLDITDFETGAGDMNLIRDCILENEDKLPEEGVTEFELQASGEWEDVFWHKYFEVASWSVLTDKERMRRSREYEERIERGQEDK